MLSKPRDVLLFILASPSGAGKTTLTRLLLERHPELQFSVSHTTRSARLGEVDGTDYHFVSRAHFERLVQENAFLEWARVHDSFYGTALSEIGRAERTPGCMALIFDIDVQGARQIRAKRPDIVAAFILPPSMTELERRLRGRGTETEESVLGRFGAARREIEHYALFDYLVVNDNLERAFHELESVVVAERARRTRRAVLAEALLQNGPRSGPEEQ
jgi:guanylate kinase